MEYAILTAQSGFQQSYLETSKEIPHSTETGFPLPFAHTILNYIIHLHGREINSTETIFLRGQASDPQVQ